MGVRGTRLVACRTEMDVYRYGMDIVLCEESKISKFSTKVKGMLRNGGYTVTVN